MRTLPALVAMIATLGGCIIYEEKYTSTPGDCVGCPGPGGDAPNPPEPDGPRLTDDLALTVREGTAGETVLTNLVSTGGAGLDPRNVVAVRFDRDVLVSDLEVRDVDVVLLLQVVDGAQPGPVEVFVRMDDGREWVLIEPFDLLQSASTDTGAPDTTGDTGGTGTTGTDGTTDTGTATGTDSPDTGATQTGTADTGLADSGDTGAP